MRPLRLAMAQINTTVGDLDGNTRIIAGAIAEARARGADLVAFPELAVTGYPPEDLVLRRRFILDNKACLESLAGEADGVVAVVGFVDGGDGKGTPIHNAAAVLANGRVAHVYHKIHLPNYGVFDERRYFAPGRECPVLELQGVRIGLSICEDVWEPVGPAEVEAAAGAEVIVNINASPFERGKYQARHWLISSLARRNRVFASYTNQVGGQDELVFDGASMIFGPNGEMIGQAARFTEQMLLVSVDADLVTQARKEHPPEAHDRQKLRAIGKAQMIKISMPGRATSLEDAAAREPMTLAALQQPPPGTPAPQALTDVEEVYEALVLGTRDYVRKTGFQKVAVGLSGGIDSSLVAVLAADAVGSENVTAITMPSRYSSPGSISDAADLALRLGIALWEAPIEPAHRAFEEILADRFKGTEPNIAEENVQARIRGNIMMTVANKFNWMVLTTGNKSEMATGYATLYGDMAGGFAVIKDVPKTMVYKLARYRNARGPGSPIPEAVITKPPSAELRPGQVDEDSLPPYSMLDRILEGYIERNESLAEIAAREAEISGAHADEGTIRKVLHMVDRSEYKRRQSPPGVKVTGLAFGRDRRLPIASRYQSR